MEQNEKIVLWKERIQNCKNSGLSIAEWCRQTGISKYVFYYWSKRVKLADQEETQKGETRFVELTPNLLKGTASGSSVMTGMDLSLLQRPCWMI